MDKLQDLLLYLPVLLLSFTVHEFAHAWVALKQGDDTAYMLGRVTLDPRAHLDPVGSILFPCIAALTGAPVLGWAKPVPVNTRKLRDYKRGDLLVSVAGVCANALLVVAFTVALMILNAIPIESDTLDLLYKMGVRGVATNVGLILFNLLPIPPLDGSRVAVHLLPPKAAAQLRSIFPYGIMILWGLAIMGAFDFLGMAVWRITNLCIDLSHWVA